ncbi:putative pectinesterase/pectinesterase inhibitor 7 [Hypsizygus marmoreus]|uniref:pectinesterase n=1 Tax=Hypsizygus marmoreus TaxID=39966 RepID=A0A369J8F4_HYPMA|nr:putative pectinesterase/pectinesterase inhibitor 7 [Hypsizygus marmoreus]
MKSLTLIVLLFIPCALGLSPHFIAFQVQKPLGISPLLGCPSGTIYVSSNRTDPFAQFHSVQDAVLSLPEIGHATILIGEGEYHETVNVTRSGALTLLGQLRSSSRYSVEQPKFPLNTPPSPTANLVQNFDNIFVQPGMDDAQSAVLIVAPSFNASLIGAGPTGAPYQSLFGNSDFKAYNIDWANRAANFAISQALVTDISYANASFYGCSFASYQDTWYTGRNASTYVVDGAIFGQTDYLFGFGTAWFQSVILANRACGGGIVAWKGTNSTDAKSNRYGAYISESMVIRSPDANATARTTGLCYLGRPWNDLATTVFLSTFMDASVRPAGWTPFNNDRPVILNTTFYAEFDSTGPGGDTTARIPSEHLLTPAQAAEFTLDMIFSGRPRWIDFGYMF